MRLKDLCKEFIVPQRDKPKEFGGSIPWCRIEDIDGKYLNGTKSNQFVSNETIRKMNLKVIPEGSVICSCSASLGVQAILTKPCITNQTFIGIVPQKELSSELLFYFLKSKTEYFKKIGSGTTIPYISRKKFEELSLPEQLLNCQNEIVSILSKVENQIALRKAELALLDNLIKARFVEMFGDMIINPNDWSKYKLGEVCDVRDGTHDSPQYYTEGYPLVTSKNVTAGRIDLTDCNLICEEDYRKINQRSKVDLGDILMPMIGTVGNPVIVNVEPDFAIKNVALIKFKKESLVLNSFIKVVLESDYFDNAVISKIRGGTQKFISLGDIRNLEICLPPLNKQKQFEEFLEQVDKSKAVIQKSLDKTHLLFDSLMQKFFT